jgi:hypothetical protein
MADFSRAKNYILSLKIGVHKRKEKRKQVWVAMDIIIQVQNLRIFAYYTLRYIGDEA